MFLASCAVVCAIFATPFVPINGGQAVIETGWVTDCRIGGVGGLYLLAAPGELWIEIEKSDLNRTGRETHLRAILFGPDRAVLDEEVLPDDGQRKGSGTGPLQRLRLTTTVPSTGVYGVNVTVTEDRYGEDIVWGFRTNCAHYLVETSRGHRDAPHEEPLVLLNPDAPGNVCFLPPQGAFAIEVKGLSGGFDALTVYDARDQAAAVMSVSDKGEVAHRFEAAKALRTGPWRLHLPKFKGVVQIDGVTRWPQRKGLPNLSLWTPERSSWFPFPENRWLLTPYSRTVYSDAGAEAAVTFEVHNNGPVETKVTLVLEFPGDQAWAASLSTDEATVAPGKSVEVQVHYRVPGEGDAWTCHLRATPSAYPAYSTYSTLWLRPGTAPATQPIPMPLVLKPYAQENEQFGYLPSYPLTNQVYFDTKNRPAIAGTDHIACWREGAWHEVKSVNHADGKAASFSLSTSKIAFDRENGLYTVGKVDGVTSLIYSTGEGMALASCPIPGKGGLDIEQFSGHNIPDGPPPLLRFTLTKKDPKIFWRRLNDLELFLPEKGPDGTISLGEPLLLSKKCIGFSAHSGIPSSMVSREGKVHIVWGEATEPEEKAPGVPAYVATVDRATRTVSGPVLVGYGPPANDVHNTPCITMDSQSYLHVLVGTHGRAFPYAHSLEPNDNSAWTEPETLGPDLRQTYVGLVCGADDTLHAVFRLWREDREYFPASHYACLAYMSKRPGEAWTGPQPLIVSPFSEYSVFYHRLTIDRAGRLFLSYDYWSTFWFYRTDHRGSRRALLMSPDAGVTWKLAELADLTR